MTSFFEYGLLLDNGTRIVHGNGALVKAAFPAEANIPGSLEVFSPGNATDPETPCFRGPQGVLHFDTITRMPRHVHITTGSGKERFVTEKVFVAVGVAMVELSGTIYVIPPKTLVVIAHGVPHTWTACPAGISIPKLLGVEGQDEVVSEGKCMVVYEYEDTTGFFPTADPKTLTDVREYTRCEELQGIRIPAMTVEEVKEKACFVWGRAIYKAPNP
jgi:hypothetical protein